MKFLGLLLLVKVTMLLMPLLPYSAASNKTTSFDSKLFYAIAKDKSLQNIILSSTSIKTCLALAYLGAEGDTASELQESLQLTGGVIKEDIAREYAKIFDKTTSSSDGGDESNDNDATLKIANRVYVNDQFDISTKFNELAGKYFNAKAESVKFEEAAATANQINAWVEAETEHKIKNIMSPDSLDGSTAAILVNTIYFKAKWSNTFDGYATAKKEFALSATRKVQVDMMYQKDTFLYGALKDLDATAIEMGYRNTDITMLIILPKSVDGLSTLEAQLRDVDLVTLTDQLQREKVRLHLPKFKIEFDISLQPILEQLGMKKMFSSTAADFSTLLATKRQIFISEIKHKAFIEVNEDGTEAAAATYAKPVLSALILNEIVYDFVADHPFFFAIKDKQTIYFSGHVALF